MTPRVIHITTRAAGQAASSHAPTFRLSLLATCLATLGTLLTGGALHDAHAFTPNPAFTPVRILQFSGTEGNTPGAIPLAPPVYVSQDKRLYGITQRGGYAYDDLYGQASFGGGVLYSLDPASPADSYLNFRAQGELGRAHSVLPYWDEATRTLYTGSITVVNADSTSTYGSYKGSLFGLRPSATPGTSAPQFISVAGPDTDMLPAANHKPQGQMTVGADGYAYYSPTLLTGYCYQANVSDKTWNDALDYHTSYYNKYFMTYRVKLDDANAKPEVFANWCDFASAYVYLSTNIAGTRITPAKREYQPYGSQPTHLLFGDQGKYLYAISQFSSSNSLYLGTHNLPTIWTGETIPENYPNPDYGIPANDNKGIPVAALIRINMEALNGNPLTSADTDKIEVLHWFAKSRDGDQIQQVVAAGSGLNSTGTYANSLIEVGDWIYGTNQGLWRIYKGNDASVSERFQVVHGFGTVSGGTSVEDDGSLPSGPLVFAADGNIYGTTYSDSRSSENGGAAATGTVFRLVIDHANPNALPSFEALQYMDLTSVGAQPTGLSAGEFTATTQRLYGATQHSENPADATTPLQQGALFSLDVPLPTVFSQDLTPSDTELPIGGTLTLRWKAENATSCSATGNNGDLWTGEKALDGSQGTSITLDKEGSYTFGLNCVRSFGGPDVESSIITVNVSASDTGAGDGDSDGGSSSGGGALGGLALLALGMSYLRRATRRN